MPTLRLIYQYLLDLNTDMYDRRACRSWHNDGRRGASDVEAVLSHTQPQTPQHDSGWLNLPHGRRGVDNVGEVPSGLGIMLRRPMLMRLSLDVQSIASNAASSRDLSCPQLWSRIEDNRVSRSQKYTAHYNGHCHAEEIMGATKA